MVTEIKKDDNPVISHSMANELAHIPPKPDVSGMNIFEARSALSKYYKEHDPEMLADFHRVGSAPAREMWGCSWCFWNKFRRVHNLPIGALRGKGVKRGNYHKIALTENDKTIPTPPPFPPPPVPEKGNFSKPESTTVDKDNLPSSKNIQAEAKAEIDDLCRYISIVKAGLPPFSCLWWPSVQKKWLEIYKELMLGK